MSMLSAQCDELRERAKTLRQGKWSDGADDARLMEDAADTIWELRCKCAGMVDMRERARLAETENAKLREQAEDMDFQLDKWQTKAEYFKQLADLAEADRLRNDAKNAKLRELVLDLYCLAYPSTVEWEVSDETYDKYSPCEKCQELHGGKSPCASTAKDMTEECCAPIQANVVADCLRELGVEVD